MARPLSKDKGEWKVRKTTTRRLHDLGFLQAEIALILGCTKQNVSKALLDLGIKGETNQPDPIEPLVLAYCRLAREKNHSWNVIAETSGKSRAWLIRRIKPILDTHTTIIPPKEPQ